MSADDYAITSWTKLGGLVRDARTAQGLTQAGLAKGAGVARSWLARVEAGHRGAGLETLLRLLDALGLALSLTASTKRPEPDGTEMAVARLKGRERGTPRRLGARAADATPGVTERLAVLGRCLRTKRTGARRSG